jgi:signal recognition particle GTPase
MPIRFLGTGETSEDLEVFDAEKFAAELIGGDDSADSPMAG